MLMRAPLLVRRSVQLSHGLEGSESGCSKNNMVGGRQVLCAPLQKRHSPVERVVEFAILLQVRVAR